MPNKKKVEFVDKLTKQLEASVSLLFVNYKGINVTNLTKIRNSLKDSNSKISIVKNTLLKIGLKNIGIEIDESIFKEPTAVVFVKDEITQAAKTISDAENDKLLTIKAGISDKELLKSEVIKKLASIPSKDVLYSEIVGSLQAPISNMVFSLNSIISSLVYTLEAVEQKQK